VTTVAASMSARTAGRLRRWLSVWHSLQAEAALVPALYGLYELGRGLVVGDKHEAVDHAGERGHRRRAALAPRGVAPTPSLLARWAA
jgi:hypothetical protein